MRSTGASGSCLLGAMLAVLALAVPAVAATGAGSGGDPFFPDAGNQGYDVSDYDLALDYDPAANRLDGVARISAVATAPLERFNLDLRRQMVVAAVSVDGVAAGFGQTGKQELVVTPAAPVAAGSSFVVEVVYGGRPEAVVDPDGSTEGWITTDDGAFVPGEPQGSPSWFPSNNSPADKASFTISITVPEGRVAIGNGVLQSRVVTGGEETFVWRQSEPMAPYLATATNGRFDLEVGSIGGLPYYEAIDPRAGGTAVLRKTPAMFDYLTGRFGPYPFSSLGAIVDFEPGVGYALETQAIPLYSATPDEATLVHELAHQWFGNAVTLKRWPDIWIHEGVARWIEWDWSEHSGGPTRREIYRESYALPASADQFWNPPPGDLGDPAHLFSASTYFRAGLMIEALVQRIGERRVIKILRRFLAENLYGNASARELKALAEEVGGDNLGRFFRDWLVKPGKPKGYGLGRQVGTN